MYQRRSLYHAVRLLVNERGPIIGSRPAPCACGMASVFSKICFAIAFFSMSVAWLPISPLQAKVAFAAKRNSNWTVQLHRKNNKG